MDFSERHILVNDTAPGTVWEPADGGGPLILVAHGGGQHRGVPAVVGRARMLMAAGFRVAALDAPGHGERTDQISPVRAVPEWRAALDLLAPDGPVGFWGVSMGAAIGLELLAVEERVTAGALGLIGDRADLAARITVPIEFVLQWDDELVPRASGLALFDAFASADKTLHANPGRHVELPRFEADSAVRFFQRHLPAV